MLKIDAHKRAMEKLDSMIDLDHIRQCEQIQTDAWMGRTPERIPTRIYYPAPKDWPVYPFTECWDDIEKNFITSMSGIYSDVTLMDDCLCTMSPEYGVVNIPELFGVPSKVTDKGNSMSEGLHDLDTIKALIDRGIPDMSTGHGAKLSEAYDFTLAVLSEYENLSKVAHLIVPDNQSPFDLAHLIWGHEILYAMYDTPQVVHDLLELLVQTYVEFTMQFKRRINQPLDTGYHCCGIKLVRGGVRLCDDSAVLCSKDVYQEFIKPYNAKVYEPFKGGWLHYCGNGNHILDEMLSTPGVNAIHMGNPDNCDLVDLYKRMRAADVMLIWSGSLERLHELKELNGGNTPTGIMVLTENRYASANLEQAKIDMDRVRNYIPIPKAPY